MEPSSLNYTYKRVSLEERLCSEVQLCLLSEHYKIINIFSSYAFRNYVASQHSIF